MFDINILRENPELVKGNIKKRFQEDKLKLVDEFFEKDKKWRELKSSVDELRGFRNKISKEINNFRKEGKSVEGLLKEVKSLPDKIKKMEGGAEDIRRRIDEILVLIPNLIHDSVPIGKDDSENVELKKIGKGVVPDFEVKHHAEIIEKFGLVDFDSAREVSGHGFYYMEGNLALLHSAVLAFARDFMVDKGFKFVLAPYMVRGNIIDGVMSFAEKDDMVYKIENEDLYLIATSEHSMIGRFVSKTLVGKDLPICQTSFSPCFRKEVGSHGLEEKGLYRLHQFEKQEMIVVCEPSESYDLYERMLGYTVELFKQLGIPVRVLECCSGDLADLKAKSADVEAWSPRQKKYYEVGSCSNLTDAQARRLNIRIDKGGKLYFAHTLNNTVVASPRVLIAIIENFQQKDGRIKVPKVLVSYMQGRKVIGDKIKVVKKKNKIKLVKNLNKIKKGGKTNE